MKLIYSVKTWLLSCAVLTGLVAGSQTPTITTNGICEGVVANFNTNDNGFNSPSIYGSVFDSSFYYHAGRGYWIDYLPPLRVNAPGFPRVLNIISPPYNNPNPVGSFNIGFYYIVNNPVTDRFQVRIISVTQTAQGTVTNVEATSGVQSFSTWSTPTPYSDITANVPDPTPFLTGSQGYVCIRLIDPDITNGANTTYRVEVSYLIGGPFFAVFDNLSIGPLNIPLPVNFIGLVANRTTDNTVQLKWDVSEEINVNEYQVERSSNGSNFTTVGTVVAKGKSIYSFTNYNTSAGTLFYRVRSVDIDGRFKYSGIIRLQGNSSNSYSDVLTAYPTPANEEVTIQHRKVTRGTQMTISSADGKVVKVVIPAEGSSHTPINLAAFRPGLYFLRFDDGQGYMQTVKLIKN